MNKSGPAAHDDENDLAVMFPEVTIHIGNRDVTVHEYSFVQGLRMRPISRAMVSDLRGAMERGEVLTDDILDVIANHADTVRTLISESAQVENNFIDGLNAADSDELLTTWWAVCGPFFVRQIIRSARESSELKKAIDGLTSSIASPKPATGSPTDSQSTPDVN